MVMIIRVSLFSQTRLGCFAVRQQIIIDEAMWQYLGCRFVQQIRCALVCCRLVK